MSGQATTPPVRPRPVDEVIIGWRQPFTSTEANLLHAEAFETRVFTDDEWDWVGLADANSFGWVTARRGRDLVGFINVVSDGFVHAWLQDVMVSPRDQGRGIGARMVDRAAVETRRAGCEWLHVDFDADLSDFYLRRCGFQPTAAGLLDLTETDR